MTTWNYAFTLAYELISDKEVDDLTSEDHLDAIERKLAILKGNQNEADGALLVDAPFDTYDMDDPYGEDNNI